MAKEFAKKFYKSKQWRQCRESFIAHRISIDGAMCEHCEDVPGFIVDHKEELTADNINDPFVSLSHDNLQYLCLTCHNKKTFSKYKCEEPKYYFDIDGQIHPLPP